jgi:hypothetical protein
MYRPILDASKVMWGREKTGMHPQLEYGECWILDKPPLTHNPVGFGSKVGERQLDDDQAPFLVGTPTLENSACLPKTRQEPQPVHVPVAILA